MWFILALLSAVFAALTSILAKIGIEGVSSNLATAIRTIVVVIMAWGMVFLTNAQKGITAISTKSWVFLVLSGLATGASWLCYYKALQLGDASKVVPIDKLSVVITLIMALVFFLTFNVIGAFLQAVLESGIESVTQGVSSFLLKFNVNPALYSLIIDGIFSGVGAVLSFLPIIITLFFFLSLMEDSGYIARVAFVMDKLLRKLGLSGRSIVPLLIGFGCTVPAVMATRTLPSERDRKMTILLTPFMSCTAKLPIYAFFVSAFFVFFEVA